MIDRQLIDVIEKISGWLDFGFTGPDVRTTIDLASKLVSDQLDSIKIASTQESKTRSELIHASGEDKWVLYAIERQIQKITVKNFLNFQRLSENPTSAVALRRAILALSNNVPNPRITINDRLINFFSGNNKIEANDLGNIGWGDHVKQPSDSNIRSTISRVNKLLADREEHWKIRYKGGVLLREPLLSK